VKDTGMGVKIEDQRNLFKLFGFHQNAQNDNNNGIGLGLNITKKIVKIFKG
jgi:signal transduction histidine kinase